MVLSSRGVKLTSLSILAAARTLAFDMDHKGGALSSRPAHWKEGGEAARREVMLKQPTVFCRLIADLMPQHFKFEHEHALTALSPEEVRLRLAEMRGKLLDAGIEPAPETVK